MELVRPKQDSKFDDRFFVYNLWVEHPQVMLGAWKTAIPKLKETWRAGRLKIVKVLWQIHCKQSSAGCRDLPSERDKLK